MNLKEIKEMISLMNENNLTELEMERDGLKIRIKKGPTGYEQQIIERVAATPSRSHETPAAQQPVSSETQKRIEIKAPMVGTFYRAPSPESPPFVEVDSRIEAGQVVCIIEAMKLMNEIKSDVSGRVVEILVESSQPIEFGQVLFILETE